MRLMIAGVVTLFATAAFAGKGTDYFKELDGNSDGQITAAEHEAATTAKFTSADANQDGVLTKGELVGFMVDEKGKSGKKAEKKSDKKMAMFDANGDGTLTREEFTTGHAEKFKKVDKDGNGSISKDEMKSAHD